MDRHDGPGDTVGDPVVTCNGCGVCCLTMCQPPFDDAPPRDGQYPCSWFNPETRQCTGYDRRPAPCRKFPVGGQKCLIERWVHADLIQTESCECQSVHAKS